MYKIYFKQALALLGQNPFISIISIAGTALAITMVMTMFVVRQVQTASVPPETNMDRTLIIRNQVWKDTTASWTNSGNLDMEKGRMLKEMRTPELVAFTHGSIYSQSPVKTPEMRTAENLNVRVTDDNFWKLMDFKWIAGRPYGAEEVEGGVSEAVISRTTANRFFPGENPLGRTLGISFKDYRVTGVVEDVSAVFPHAYANIWVPYTTQNTEHMSAFILARDKKDFAAIREEVIGLQNKWDLANQPQTLWMQPLTKRENASGGWGFDERSYRENVRTKNIIRALTIALLIIIPAVNIAGFSLARIKKRVSEIGIRKAFGARRRAILVQVLYENLITSFIGGIIGLLFTWIIVLAGRSWLLDIPAGNAVPALPLFSLPVFGAVFMLCLVLNLLSAGLPAYRASRMSIVNCLNRNDNRKW